MMHSIELHFSNKVPFKKILEVAPKCNNSKPLKRTKFGLQSCENPIWQVYPFYLVIMEL